MKKLISNTKYMLLAFMMITIACSKDDDVSPSINATDFNTTIDENPTSNTSLGAVIAAGVGGGLSYSISSQTPTGALSINSNTGELKVADASLYDFETNPTIDAVVTILNAVATTTINATINLNNIDDISFYLSTSKTTYDNANSGDWVEVTETEYNDLANKLNEVSKSGTTDIEYNTTPNSNGFFNLTNANITSTAIIPKDNYIFAFKYAVNSPSSNITGTKVKQSSTANNSGFIDLGTPLPAHTTSDPQSSIYFVLKGNNTPITNTGYLATYHNNILLSAVFIGDGSVEGFYTSTGDVQELTGIQPGVYNRYQGLSTAQKQWD